ncbi:hypothetical protein CLU79DRAFT_97475 [Phycomyces nitens]|nr:hypothetical protein CLU79DRAFT_97475 [Phycomyces nitens]
MTYSVILHWSKGSPYSFRVAWALNYKNVDYKTVEVAVAEPRPLRRPLDGGYRKTPILQIDNHVYCDTKIILEELEKRYPEPSFYPATRSGLPSQGLCKSLELWAGNGLMYSILPQFSASTNIPETLYKDRAAYFNFSSKEDAIADAPYLAIETQAQLEIADELLRSNKAGKEWFLDTATPSLADFHFGMCVYFALEFLGEDWANERFPCLVEHQKRFLKVVEDKLGEKRQMLSEKDALEISRNETVFAGKVVGNTPLKAGMLVSVTPLDLGKVPVVGTLVQLTSQEIVIERETEEYGNMFNHFPLVGFIVRPA